jgi:hypothetical protein
VPRNPENGNDHQGVVESRADPKTGAFAIKDVPPGNYAIVALTRSQNKSYTATQEVVVENSDIHDLALVIGPGIELPGRVTLEGKSAAYAAPVGIFLEPKEENGMARFASSHNVSMRSNGSFALSDVSDGSYVLTASSSCNECYLKPASANAVDLLARGVEISGGTGPGPITIVYSSNSGTVSGGVANQDELPAVGATVVLVPGTVAGAPQKPEGCKRAVTDQYGHFEVTGLPPGHYEAYARETPDEDVYGDPEELKKLRGKQEAFEVDANEKKSVQLKMIPAAESAN